VSAALKLRAELHAFLKAKVCFFTIVDKDWELGGVDLANIPLGTFKPFAPIEFNIGGPDQGFKNGSPKFNNDKDKIMDGVKSGSQGIGDDAAPVGSRGRSIGRLGVGVGVASLTFCSLSFSAPARNGAGASCPPDGQYSSRSVPPSRA